MARCDTVVLITEQIKGADVIYVHCRRCARGRSDSGEVYTVVLITERIRVQM